MRPSFEHRSHRSHEFVHRIRGIASRILSPFEIASRWIHRKSAASLPLLSLAPNSQTDPEGENDPSFKRYLIALHFAYEFDSKSRRIVASNKSNLFLVLCTYSKENTFVKGYEKTRSKTRNFENDEIITYTRIEKFLKKIDEGLEGLFLFNSLNRAKRGLSRYKRRKVSRILPAFFAK